MTVYYEWDVEEVDENEDIQNHNHTSSYTKAKEVAAIPNEGGIISRIVLVRDDDNCRSWAYMEDGKLPEWFEDAYGAEVAKVPKRFIKEVENASK
jgi:hypothetical protein